MNFRKLLSLTLSFQLIIGPVSAQAASGGELLNKLADMAGNVMNGGSFSNPNRAQDQQFLTRMQAPQSDKYFNNTLAAKVPGLQAYLNSIGKPNALVCNTLRSSLDEVKSDVCTLGVMNNKGVPDAQLAEMDFYADQYNSIRKLYQNYQVDSGSELSQQYGVGCMNNAQQILNGFFEYRLNKMNDNLLAIEKINEDFKKQAEADLNAIAEDTAVLEGGDGELATQAKSRRPDLFDFAKRFNNASCNSMASSDEMKTMGAKGLNNINNTLKTAYETPSGKYRGSSFAAAYPTVVSDIQTMAKNAATQAKLNFNSMTSQGGFSSFVNGLSGSISSSEGLNSLLKADLFADVQQSFNESNTKLQTSMSTLASELGSNGSAALAAASNINATSFESEISRLEIGIKNSCLSDSPASKSLDRIISPTASSYANKNSANYYRDRLKAVMADSSTSFEKKLADIESIQQSEGSDYQVQMQTGFTKMTSCNGGSPTYEKITGNVTASLFLSNAISVCDCQFKYNKINTMSGASAIAQLRKVNQEYKNLATKNAGMIQDQITKRLISCDTTLKASATTVGSCTPQSFDTTESGFCAANALSCATKMKACTDQTAGYVKEIKADRTKRVNNYKNQVTAYKAQTAAIFKMVMDQFRLEATVLQRNFGVGWTTPTGLQTEVPESARYRSDFSEMTQQAEDKLLIEDPTAYLEMYRNNMKLLVKQVEDQQKELMGNNGLFAKHIAQTKKNYTTVAQEADEFYRQCADTSKQYKEQRNQMQNKMAEEQQKKNQELGEKTAKFCKQFRIAQENPIAGCGPASDLADDAGYVTGQGIASYAKICEGRGNSETSAKKNAEQICLEYRRENPDQKTAKADKTSIGGLCSGLISESAEFCPVSTTVTGDDDKKPAKEQKDCTNTRNWIVAYYYDEKSSGSNSSVDVELPAECVSQNNSDRSVGENTINNVTNILNNSQGFQQ